MKNSLMGLGVAVALFTVSALRADEPKDFHGKWEYVEWRHAGEKLSEEKHKSLVLVIGPKECRVEAVDKLLSVATYKVGEEKKLRTVELDISHGNFKDKKMLAIFEINGDTMRICYDLEGKAFPTEFSSTKENKWVLVTYKRKK
jgi:uncharacterized protein (TIGR03067 family)